MSVINDYENDKLCIDVADGWVDIPIRYKPLLDPDNEDGESLRSTTHHCRYTRQVEHGALAWYFKNRGVRLKPLRKGHITGKQLAEEMEVYDLF